MQDEGFKATGLPVEVGTGGRTKFNRVSQAYPKAHWIDAACIGESGTKVSVSPTVIPLRIKATGRGRRQMCTTDAHGYPNAAPKQRNKDGWVTGDMVRANVKTGKYSGVYPVGRVIAKAKSVIFLPAGWEYKDQIAVNSKYLKPLHCSDGYGYS